jgi:oligoribonuclease NrnB/cAMP/cGMP phosphodiesterase (DHH superfamily)
MKILSISHYDMDGFGCQLCINEKFKNHDITFDNCSYGKIEETIWRYNFNDYDLIFITDLNFN